MIIIKELFVNFPRFHRDYEESLTLTLPWREGNFTEHRDTETQSFISNTEPTEIKGIDADKQNAQKPHPCPHPSIKG